MHKHTCLAEAEEGRRNKQVGRVAGEWVKLECLTVTLNGRRGRLTIVRVERGGSRQAADIVSAGSHVPQAAVEVHLVHPVEVFAAEIGEEAAAVERGVPLHSVLQDVEVSSGSNAAAIGVLGFGTEVHYTTGGP